MYVDGDPRWVIFIFEFRAPNGSSIAPGATWYGEDIYCERSRALIGLTKLGDASVGTFVYLHPLEFQRQVDLAQDLSTEVPLNIVTGFIEKSLEMGRGEIPSFILRVVEQRPMLAHIQITLEGESLAHDLVVRVCRPGQIELIAL